MELFDSHCHLYDDKYEGKAEEIVKNARENDVLYMANIGTDEETSRLVVEQAKKYDGVYAVIGLYPEFCNDDELDLSFIERLLEENGERCSPLRKGEIKKSGEQCLPVHRRKDCCNWRNWT